MKWISVKERLPVEPVEEDNCVVVLATNTYYRRIITYNITTGQFQSLKYEIDNAGLRMDLKTEHPTHWQPMPERPSREELNGTRKS